MSAGKHQLHLVRRGAFLILNLPFDQINCIFNCWDGDANPFSLESVDKEMYLIFSPVISKNKSDVQVDAWKWLVSIPYVPVDKSSTRSYSKLNITTMTLHLTWTSAAVTLSKLASGLSHVRTLRHLDILRDKYLQTWTNTNRNADRRNMKRW